MNSIIKNIIIVVCLLLTSHVVFSQVYTLKTISADDDLKIICDSVYFFMDRKDVIDILKKMAKTDKKNYKMPIKKMKGICFEAINLRKPNDDKDIALLQQLFLKKIIYKGIITNKIAAQWKNDKKFITEVHAETIATIDSTSLSDAKRINFLDSNEAIVFKIY
jgi:hypothetical protein